MDVVQLDAIVTCRFKPITIDQLSVRAGDLVQIIHICDRRAFVRRHRDDDKRSRAGWVPNYVLEPADMPGKTFAEQIEYRRNWYRQLDGAPTTANRLASTNLANLLHNIPFVMPKLHSFIPSASAFTIESDRICSPIRAALLSANREYRPQIIRHLDDVQLKVDHSASFVCAVDANPPATFEWNGAALFDTSARVHIETSADGDESRLTIERCRIEDSGQYTVSISNSIGKSISIAWLKVIEPPGLARQLQAIHLDCSTVKLQWHAPYSRGNATDIWYTVLYRTSDMNEFEIAVDCVCGLSVILDDLHPSTVYQFKLRVYNEMAIGRTSDPITTFTGDNASMAESGTQTDTDM